MPDESLGAEFVWDEDKSNWTLAERGFDFAFAARIFENDYAESFDDLHSEVEDRFICMGYVDGVCLTVIYTQRGDFKRIISAWRSTKRERDIYARYIESNF